jgi:cytochrome b6-f complex iron-sulfur subunit
MNSERTDTAETNTPRRSFINKLWWGLGILALAEFVGLIVAFLRPRQPQVGQGSDNAVVAAGDIDDFGPDTVTAFVRGRFYLARLADGGFMALSSKCTHLGCTLPWDAEARQFACPCHASAFDITGTVIRAPAPRALDMYPVAIENRIVKVDTSRPIRRSAFRADQVVYAKT